MFRVVVAIGSLIAVYIAIQLLYPMGPPFDSLFVLGSAVWAGRDTTNSVVVLGLSIFVVLTVVVPLLVMLFRRVARGNQPHKDTAVAAVTPDAASPAQVPTPASVEFERLADLRARGVLTEEEFAAAKATVLRTSPPPAAAVPPQLAAAAPPQAGRPSSSPGCFPALAIVLAIVMAALALNVGGLGGAIGSALRGDVPGRVTTSKYFLHWTCSVQQCSQVMGRPTGILESYSTSGQCESALTDLANHGTIQRYSARAGTWCNSDSDPNQSSP